MKIGVSYNCKVDIEISTAKNMEMASEYELQKRNLELEDAVLLSAINRQKLRLWLIQNGIKETEVDKFIEENSKYE